MKPNKSRSGPNIPEAQRHTVRLRLPRDAHATAERLARKWGCTVVEAISLALAKA
jgi:hypothetical protein